MAVHAPRIVERWRTIIDDWRSSGLSVTAFCRSRQVCKSGFHRWRIILDQLDHNSAIPPRPVAEPRSQHQSSCPSVLCPMRSSRSSCHSDFNSACRCPLMPSNSHAWFSHWEPRHAEHRHHWHHLRCRQFPGRTKRDRRTRWYRSHCPRPRSRSGDIFVFKLGFTVATRARFWHSRLGSFVAASP